MRNNGMRRGLIMLLIAFVAIPLLSSIPVVGPIIRVVANLLFIALPILLPVLILRNRKQRFKNFTDRFNHNSNNDQKQKKTDDPNKNNPNQEEIVAEVLDVKDLDEEDKD